MQQRSSDMIDQILVLIVAHSMLNTVDQSILVCVCVWLGITEKEKCEAWH